MKAHLIDTHLLVKVICKGQGQISGSCFSKDGCFGGISVSQTHLVFNPLLHRYSKFMHQQELFKTLWEKKEDIARNELFLLFPQCVLLN